MNNNAKFNKIRFFGGFAAEKTPFRRAGRARAPRGAVKIEDFCGGDKRALNCKAQFYNWMLAEDLLANLIKLADIPEESGEDILISDVLGGLEGH